jgi:hypothetical protein
LQQQYGLEPTPFAEKAAPKWSPAKCTWSQYIQIGGDKKTYYVSYRGQSEEDKDHLHKKILYVIEGLVECIEKAGFNNGVEDVFIIPYRVKVSTLQKEQNRLEKEFEQQQSE